MSGPRVIPCCMSNAALGYCSCIPEPRSRKAVAKKASRYVEPEPPPHPSTAPAAWALVLEDMRARDAFGERKYGVRLTPGDGRDSLKDAYQEALDLCVYLRKALYERDGQ